MGEGRQGSEGGEVGRGRVAKRGGEGAEVDSRGGGCSKWGDCRQLAAIAAAPNDAPRIACCLSLTHCSAPPGLRGCYSARGGCLCCLPALFLWPPPGLRPRPRPRPLLPCWREPTSCGGRK